MADDIDDNAEKLETDEAEEEDDNAQEKRQQTIPAKLPRHADKASHQFAG